MSGMRKKIGFLLLVALFTIFGGGRKARWTQVYADNYDFVYQIDTTSVEHRSGELVGFDVKIIRDEKWRIDRWVIDPSGPTLTVRVNEGSPEPVGVHSPAWHAVLYLREHALLK